MGHQEDKGARELPVTDGAKPPPVHVVERTGWVSANKVGKKELTKLSDSSLLVVLSLASESLLKGRTHLSLNLLSSVIATPMPCRMLRTCLMTSMGGAEVTVDGSTAPW